MATNGTEKKGKRFSDAEREFIRNSYPCLSSRAMAKKLCRSRTGVDKIIRQMVEDGEIVQRVATVPPPGTVPASPPADSGDGRQDTLGRLRWVRGLLERQLYDAEPTAAARLAKEYRDTVQEIDRLEREGGGDNDLAGQFADLLAAKLG